MWGSDDPEFPALLQRDETGQGYGLRNLSVPEASQRAVSFPLRTRQDGCECSDQGLRSMLTIVPVRKSLNTEKESGHGKCCRQFPAPLLIFKVWGVGFDDGKYGSGCNELQSATSGTLRLRPQTCQFIRSSDCDRGHRKTGVRLAESNTGLTTTEVTLIYCLPWPGDQNPNRRLISNCRAALALFEMPKNGEVSVPLYWPKLT